MQTLFPTKVPGMAADPHNEIDAPIQHLPWPWQHAPGAGLDGEHRPAPPQIASATEGNPEQPPVITPPHPNPVSWQQTPLRQYGPFMTSRVHSAICTGHCDTDEDQLEHDGRAAEGTKHAFRTPAVAFPMALAMQSAVSEAPDAKQSCAIASFRAPASHLSRHFAMAAASLTTSFAAVSAHLVRAGVVKSPHTTPCNNGRTFANSFIRGVVRTQVAP